MAKKKSILTTKKPKIKKWISDKKPDLTSSAGDEVAPRITNDTVAEHREEVLAEARRFVYPLQHNRHKVAIISAAIVIGIIALSLIASLLMLYRFKSTSEFAYRISQLVPFPVSRVNGAYVGYDDYLFEVKNSLFYYRNHGQEGVDIDDETGSDLLLQTYQQSLDKVKLDALAKMTAKEYDVEISEQEVDEAIEEIRSQGGVGESDQVLEDILLNFYDWEVEDLRHTVKLQLYRQKLPQLVDTTARDKASATLAKLTGGQDFSELAKQNSEDLLTKENGGVIGLISRTNTDLPKEFIDAAFNLEPGQASSELVESDFGLHIIKVLSVDGEEREVAHMLFNYINIDQYLTEKLEEADVRDFISL